MFTLRLRVLEKNLQYIMKNRLRKSFQLPFARSQVLTHAAVSFRHKWSNWNTVKKCTLLQCKTRLFESDFWILFWDTQWKITFMWKRRKGEREHIHFFGFDLMSTHIRVTSIIQYIFMYPSYKVNIPGEILNSHF